MYASTKIFEVLPHAITQSATVVPAPNRSSSSGGRYVSIFDEQNSSEEQSISSGWRKVAMSSKVSIEEGRSKKGDSGMLDSKDVEKRNYLCMKHGHYLCVRDCFVGEKWKRFRPPLLWAPYMEMDSIELRPFVINPFAQRADTMGHTFVSPSHFKRWIDDCLE